MSTALCIPRRSPIQVLLEPDAFTEKAFFRSPHMSGMCHFEKYEIRNNRYVKNKITFTLTYTHAHTHNKHAHTRTQRHTGTATRHLVYLEVVFAINVFFNYYFSLLCQWSWRGASVV